MTPAQARMLVVPDPAQLVVEARVDNTNVGFIHSGQRAEVRVDTFGVTAETYSALPALSSNGGKSGCAHIRHEIIDLIGNLLCLL